MMREKILFIPRDAKEGQRRPPYERFEGGIHGPKFLACFFNGL